VLYVLAKDVQATMDSVWKEFVEVTIISNNVRVVMFTKILNFTDVKHPTVIRLVRVCHGPGIFVDMFIANIVHIIGLLQNSTILLTRNFATENDLGDLRT
jgi:hypothetical protein